TTETQRHREEKTEGKVPQLISCSLFPAFSVSLCLCGSFSLSEPQAGDFRLLAVAAEDHRAALDLLLVGAGVAGDGDVDVRLAAEQVGVGPVVVDEDDVLALPGLADVVPLRPVALRLVLRQL